MKKLHTVRIEVEALVFVEDTEEALDLVREVLDTEDVRSMTTVTVGDTMKKPWPDGTLVYHKDRYKDIKVEEARALSPKKEGDQ